MLFAFVLLALSSFTASAASWDPALTWKTVRTEHFAITFHEGEEQLALEMEIAAEQAWDTMTAELDYAPRKPIQLVLVDWTDSANGYATVVPQNTIVIFVTAPEEDSSLGLYEDWNSAIITHELTHILHIDTVRGLPRLVRAIMGSLISTHQISPGWVIEGFATFQETRHTRAGRGRSAGVDMVKRAAVLEDQFPPLGNMDGFQVLPPGGNLRYLFGQDFIQFIADRAGSEKWTEWLQRYGASVPYLMPARKIFGESFVSLHKKWKAALQERYGQQVARLEAEGLTPATFLTPEGEACGSPSWSPNGEHLAYSCTSPRVGARIYLANKDGQDPKVVIRDKSARNMSWRKDSGAFVFSSTHTVDLYYAFEDLYIYDIAEDDIDALTHGARARDPVFSPDGQRLLMVTNELQNTELAQLTVDQKLEPLTHTTDHTQYGTPRFSPDGRFLALTVWRDGLRDLWIYTPDGVPWRRLTADAAMERDPAWSADGRYLYFTSDRSGIPAIYALELASEELFQVTNVTTGAYGPSPHPDGERLAFQYFSTAGTRVALMDLDRTAWKPLGALPRLPGQPEGSFAAPASLPVPSAPPSAGLVAAPTEPHPTPAEDPRPEIADARPYDPLPSLLPPRFWVPGGYLTSTGDSIGVLGIAQTGGYDTLRYFAYSAYLTYRTDAGFLGGGGSFTVNRWRPVLSIGASTSVSPYGDVSVHSDAPAGASLPGIESTRTRYWDRRVRAYAQMGYQLDDRSAFSIYYNGTLRSSLDPLPDDVYLATLPTRGFFSSLGASWRYGKGQSYALSISPEKARSLAVSAEVTTRWLGSSTYDDEGNEVPFDQVQATAEWREYVTNPFVPNHVLAWKLAGGASLGDTFRYGSFRLGGTFSENGITVVPSEWRSLRGFYPASDSGEWYWLASTEYRFPLWNVDRGVGTLPLFVRNVSAAVVADAGNAWTDADGAGLENTLAGVGAELRVYTIWSYGYGIYARFGYAMSIAGGGIPPGDLDGFYATLGSSF